MARRVPVGPEKANHYFVPIKPVLRNEFPDGPKHQQWCPGEIIAASATDVTDRETVRFVHMSQAGKFIQVITVCDCDPLIRWERRIERAILFSHTMRDAHHAIRTTHHNLLEPPIDSIGHYADSFIR